MNSHRLFFACLLMALFGVSLAGPATAGETAPRPTLDPHKRYKTPRDAILQYTARDAHGFYWTGMLQSERQALTRWERSPQNEGAYLISRYEVGDAEVEGDKARVTVSYHLVGVTDFNGQITPPDRYLHSVTFELGRATPQDGWRILSPAPEAVAAYVHYSTMEGSFSTRP